MLSAHARRTRWGKTRLALEVAARRVDRYPHGVHFVPLVSVASPDLLAPALAESIQFAVDGAHSGFSSLYAIPGRLLASQSGRIVEGAAPAADTGGMLAGVRNLFAAYAPGNFATAATTAAVTGVTTTGWWPRSGGALVDLGQTVNVGVPTDSFTLTATRTAGAGVVRVNSVVLYEDS